MGRVTAFGPAPQEVYGQWGSKDVMANNQGDYCEEGGFGGYNILFSEVLYKKQKALIPTPFPFKGLCSGPALLPDITAKPLTLMCLTVCFGLRGGGDPDTPSGSSPSAGQHFVSFV